MFSQSVIRRSTIMRCSAVALLVATGTMTAQAGVLVPGRDGLWQELASLAATTEPACSRRCHQSDSQPTAPRRDPNGHLHYPATGMTTTCHVPPRLVTGALMGWIPWLIGDELRSTRSGAVGIGRPSHVLERVFRPPRGAHMRSVLLRFPFINSKEFP